MTDATTEPTPEADVPDDGILRIHISETVGSLFTVDGTSTCAAGSTEAARTILVQIAAHGDAIPTTRVLAMAKRAQAFLVAAYMHAGELVNDLEAAIEDEGEGEEDDEDDGDSYNDPTGFKDADADGDNYGIVDPGSEPEA